MSQPIIVLNCGSSSIKFAIIDAINGESSITGIAENLGNIDAQVKYKCGEDKQIMNLNDKATHSDALQVIETIIKQQPCVPVAVGHRVVHGGEAFTGSVLITDKVKQAIADTAHMAPLHNPANLAGIECAQQAFPELPQVAVFDTAFFQTLPQKAFLYALPYKLYKEHGIRRYGFHGSSHLFVSQEAAKQVSKPVSECNFITAHLGNGCSITAIKKGKAIDTSLGFTPLEGLVMGTRCGDIDPSLPGVLINQLGYTAAQVDTILNKESGLLGLSQLSNDCRTLEEQALNGNRHAKLALDVFCYRLAKYLGSYMAITGPLDGIVFTGGIGENSDYIRTQVLAYFQHMGINVDETANQLARFGKSGNINQDSLPVLVIPTNEEWVIAEDTLKLTQ